MKGLIKKILKGGTLKNFVTKTMTLFFMMLPGLLLEGNKVFVCWEHWSAMILRTHLLKSNIKLVANECAETVLWSEHVGFFVEKQNLRT